MSLPRDSTGWPLSSITTGRPAWASSSAANSPAGPLQTAAPTAELDFYHDQLGGGQLLVHQEDVDAVTHISKNV